MIFRNILCDFIGGHTIDSYAPFRVSQTTSLAVTVKNIVQWFLYFKGMKLALLLHLTVN